MSVDFVLVSGDAYVDHSSFGAAIIRRLLESKGYTVGLLSQPDWHSADSFRTLGKPRLAFLITAGNLDSMVNHYTAAKRRRSEDAYSPNGEAGRRPDRAGIVYANRCREAWPDTPIVLGGIEASLRRFAHYDYWDDRVRHSLLYDAGADILVYGMGERAIIEIATLLERGVPVKKLLDIRGTCVRVPDGASFPDAVRLPSFMEVASDKRAYARAFLTEMREQDAVRGKRLLQAHEKGFLLCNPPAMPLERDELDAVYALPFTGKAEGGARIPALEETRFSLTSTRGCFGGCSFCALTFHQGRAVRSRSHESLLAEARALVQQPDFKGYIHDVGGPTANFRQPACQKQIEKGVCAEKQCIGWTACKNLNVDESDYAALLRKLRQLKGVKKVFVRSGVRFDYLLMDRAESFFRELAEYHISGQLKVAPEHVSDRVLRLMNKPPHAVFERFVQKYEAFNKKLGRDQYIVPYLISSHPGSTLDDAIELALYIKRSGHRPEQVQDFYPTPGTLSTCMYYTGVDPVSGESLFVARTSEEKAMQRALMQFWLPQNQPLARKALQKAGRDDLIGAGRDCLVPAARPRQRPKQGKIPVDKKRRSRYNN